jgi:hypothetical protein
VKDNGFRERYRLRRSEAYAQGRLEFGELAADRTFRDFVCLFIAEGSKRNRNRVAVANRSPRSLRSAHGGCGILLAGL